MASNMYWQFGIAADPNQLAAQVLYDHQFESEFSELTGENYFKYWGNAVSAASDADNPAMPGGMIVEHMDLKQGHTTLEIPVIVPDRTMPVFGDQDVKNLENRSNIVYIAAGINRIKMTHPIVKGLQTQVLGPNLTAQLNNGAQYLKRRLTQYIDKDLYHTVFNGASISMSNLSGKLNARAFSTPHSHANFFTLQGGMVDNVTNKPGTAGYETQVVGALNGVLDTDKLTPEFIEELEYRATLAKIPYFDTKFGKRRIIIVSEAGMKQLKQNEAFRTAQNFAFMGKAWEAPAHSNYRAQWSQSLIFSTAMIPGVRLTAPTPNSVATNTAFNGMPYYSPTGWYDDLEVIDTSPLRLGILCGPDMLHKAYGQEAVQFTSYVDTAADKELMILSATMGYVLADIFDTDGKIPGGSANDFYSNRTSMVFAHWAK